MHCCFESVSGLVSVVFVYKSSLKLVALLLNCAFVEQQAVICFFCHQKALNHLKVIEESYQDMVKKKHRVCYVRVFSLLHNNSRLHLAAATIEAIRQLKFELPYPHVVGT